MQGARHQLLAGACFPFDQHRRQVVAGHALLCIEQLAQGVLEVQHRRGFADQRLQPRLLRLTLLVERQGAFHALGRQGFIEHQLEFGQHHRLGQVMERAFFHGQHGVFDIAVSGHHDHLELRRLGDQCAQQLVAVHARQGVVSQYGIGQALLDLLQSQLRAMADRDFEPLQTEVGTYVVREDLVILDHQNAGPHGPLPLQY